MCGLWRPLAVIGLVAGLTVGLAACDPVMKSVGQGLWLASGVGQTSVEASATDPDIGYLRVISGPEALFVLAYREHGQEVWLANGPVALTVRQGVVARQTGLSPALLHSRLSGPGAAYFDAGLHTLPLQAPQRLIRERQLAGQSPWQHHYQLMAEGRHTVSVWGGQRRELLRVVESPLPERSPSAPRWPGAIYWVDPDTGDVVASRQWLSPEREFSLLPRSPVARLPVAAAPDAVAVTVNAPLRLSQLLRSQAALVQAPASELVVLAGARQAASLRDWRELLVDLREAGLPELHARIAALSPQPRLPLASADAYWLEASPAQDPLLQAGDQVHRYRPQAWTVIGPRGEWCQQTLQNVSVRAALQACGLKRPDSAWLLQADGVGQTLSLGRWNAKPAPRLQAGDVLVLMRDEVVRQRLARVWWQAQASIATENAHAQ